MKDLWKSGVLILLVIGILYIVFLRECKSPPPCPAEDEIIVKKVDWQSMIDAANKPPVVRIETTYIEKPPIVIHPPLPDPVPIDSGINTYQDSLVNKEIKVWYDLTVKGTLMDRTWRYIPLTTVVTIDSLIYMPYPVEVEKLVKQPQNGFYVYGVAGGNANSFLFGGGLDYITKKNTELGYMYQRFGTDNFHSFKLGVRLFNKK